MPRMDIFVPEPPGGCEWVIAQGYDQSEALIAAGARPVARKWVPIRCYSLLEDDLGQPLRLVDAPWMGSHGLVLKPPARKALEGFLGDSVDYLPTIGSDYDELYYVHVRKLANAIDLAGSRIVRFDSGDILTIEKHEFLPEIVDAGPIFKLAAMPRGGIYLTGELVDAIRASGLTGFDFQKVWSGNVLDSDKAPGRIRSRGLAKALDRVSRILRNHGS